MTVITTVGFYNRLFVKPLVTNTINLGHLIKNCNIRQRPLQTLGQRVSVTGGVAGSAGSTRVCDKSILHTHVAMLVDT